MIYVGAGTSGRLGVLDAAECPPTFGTPPEMVIGLIAGGAPALVRSIEGAEDDTAAAERELNALGVGQKDVVVGIAASGTTRMLGPRSREPRRSAQVPCLFRAPSRPPGFAELRHLHHRAGWTGNRYGFHPDEGRDGHEAGTEQLTTGAMIRIGKTYRDLMVDLRAWNDKLVDRSQRIVMEAAGVDRSAAQSAIEAADGSVKTAIVMARRGVARGEAERLLSEHAGRLRAIVGDPPPVRTR